MFTCRIWQALTTLCTSKLYRAFIHPVDFEWLHFQQSELLERWKEHICYIYMYIHTHTHVTSIYLWLELGNAHVSAVEQLSVSARHTFILILLISRRSCIIHVSDTLFWCEDCIVLANRICFFQVFKLKKDFS